MDEVIVTADLSRRPARAPDFESERHALVDLMRATAERSGDAGSAEDARMARVLQELVEKGLALCRAHSCGVSILEEDNGREVFRWRAAAGQWARYLNVGVPRESSPSSAVLDRNTPLLVARPQRHFSYGAAVELPIVEVLLVPFHHSGRPVGTIWVIAHDASRQFDAEDLRLLTSLAQFASLTYQLLREHEERLANELSAMRQLEAISTLLIPDGRVEALYERILEALVALMRSDFASLQILHPERGSDGELRLLGHRGFNPEAVAYWTWVRPTAETACGVALRTHARCIIPDIETSDFMAGSDHQAMCRKAGVRAMQTTPLLSRSGAMLGAISTHWRQPHQPSQRDLDLLDVLARQAADLIDRTRTEQALREGNAELSLQDRRKDLFLATLGHELRNPLAVLDLGMQLLQQGGDRVRVEGMLERNIRQLTMIVDDLLEVSRITRGKLELHKEPTDLAALVRSALEVWQPSAREKQQELGAELPDSLIAEVDPTRFEEVVVNLLSNAIKYTPVRGSIRVVLSALEEEAFLSVSDSGQGLQPEDLSAIFEPFIQVNPETGGLGIGLAVARGLIELHGGSLIAESPGIGLGSTFRVRIPRGDVGRLAAERPVQLPSLPHDLRVLIVDDVQDYADTHVILLRTQGCQAVSLHSASAVFEHIAELQPHVVLLDLGLPDWSGYEVAERIRRESLAEKTWLIAVTGFGDSGARERARAAGFDQLLTKPIDTRLLHELLLARARAGL